MTSSPAAGFCSMSPFHRHKTPNKFPHVRSQSFKDDQGKSADIVDANLSVLKKRIDEVKKKEKLMIINNNSTTTCSTLKNGWNYDHQQNIYDHKLHKRSRSSGHQDHIISETMEMVGLVSGAVGFVFLCGSLCICLVPFLVTLSMY